MKSIKLAIIALLGFSTACSTVKEGAKNKKTKSDNAEVAPSIIVMYGVRRPVEPQPEVKPAEVTAPTIIEQNGHSATNKSEDKISAK